MFEEMVPPELRDALTYCDGQLSSVERVVAWALTMARVPKEFEAYIDDHIARMRTISREVLEQYRRGQIPLDVALRRLEVECDVDQLEPPSADQIRRRSSAPPDWL